MFDEIASIEPLEGIRNSIDVVLDGNKLFYANGILTHNSGIDSSDVEMTDTSECIWVEEKVTLRDGTVKRIADVTVGDQLKDGTMYKTVSMVHHPKKKECFKITLASGKTIVVSADHVFPTNVGRINIKSGLSVGHKLHSV